MSLSTSIKAWTCWHFLMEQPSPQKLIWAIACPVRQRPFSTSFFTVYNPSSDTAGGGVSGTVAHARAPSDLRRGSLRKYRLRQQHLRHKKCRERGHLKRQQICPLNYKLNRRGPRQPLNHPLGFLGREVKKLFQRCNPLWWCSPANTGLGEVYLWIQQCMTNSTLQPPWWVLNSFNGPFNCLDIH